MKKWISLCLVFAMALSLAACGSKTGENSSSAEGSTLEDVMPGGETEGSTDEIAPEDSTETTDGSSTEEGMETPATPTEEKPSDSNSTTSNKPSTNNSSSGSDTSSKPSGNSSSTNSSSNSGSTGSSNSAGTDAAKGYSGSLSSLISAIYDKQSVDIRLGDPTAISLTDADAVKYYLGLSDATGLTGAEYSEAQIGSQAYSLCVARATDSATAQTLAQSMFDGINTRKWVCVGADTLTVATYGDTIFMVMVDSELSPTLYTDLRSAFASVCGGSLDKTLERTDAD